MKLNGLRKKKYVLDIRSGQFVLLQPRFNPLLNACAALTENVDDKSSLHCAPVPWSPGGDVQQQIESKKALRNA